ncbi:MAG: tetratricopeptide repeat protein [Bacteroidetes bacterium]|nr:tetratricopeptide repeat protein [Bacteroidota bacterium]
MKANKLQLLIVACSAVLFVLLFIANKKSEKKADTAVAPATPQDAAPSVDLKTIVDAQIAVLSPKDKEQFQTLSKNINDTASINTLVDFCNEKKMPAASCFFFQKKAEKANTPKMWYHAGNRYFYTTGFVQEATQKQSLLAAASFCYSKALALKADYTDAKIQLASCMVEGSTNPMKGIALLKEVEQADSTNVQVQMVLAGFAVKSAQYDKALLRYQKVLRLQPDYMEAYLFLADAYEKQGEKNKAIETLKKYVALTPDKEIKEQIKKYILQLQNS